MSVYLLMCLPERGAYYPTFALARALEVAGHRVIYLGNEEFRADVERQGLTFVTMFPDSPTQDPNVGEIPTSPLRKLLWYRRKIMEDPRRFRLLEAIVNGGIERLLKLHRVDVVLLDPFLHQLAAACLCAGVPVISMATELMNYRDYAIPPNNTLCTPTNSIGSRWFSYALWLKKLGLSFLLRGGVFAGMKLIRWPTPPRELIRKSKSLQKRARLSSTFSEYGWRAILPEFVLCPRAFDFPIASSTTRRYLGVTVDPTRVEVPLEEPIPSDKKVIFASLGTHAAIYGKRVDHLTSLLIEVASERPECFFIVNIGKGNDPAKFGPVPANVLLKTFVPQLYVLSRSAVIITNGGLGTVKEAIMAEVPLLVVPCRWDQFGNAARVKYHGIGMTSPLKKVTVPLLSRHIDELLNNSSYTSQLTRMKRQIEQDDEFSKGLRWLTDTAGTPSCQDH